MRQWLERKVRDGQKVSESCRICTFQQKMGSFRQQDFFKLLGQKS